MNYGYEPTNFDDQLASALTKFVEQLPLDGRGMRPSVEANGPYPGVRIRRITHYSSQMQDYIISEADKILKRFETEAKN